MAASARMAASTRMAAELFWRFNARSRAGGFGRHLGLILPDDGGDVEVTRMERTTCAARVSVPAWLCDAHGVTAAGLVALFDEVSSFTGAVHWDTRCRPGVSVQLAGVATPAIRAVGPGDRIEVVTRLQRMGRTLAFLEVDVFKAATGECVMRGRHLKFMPGTGVRPEWIMAPALRGTSLAAMHWYVGRQPRVERGPAPAGFADVFRGSPDGGYDLSSEHANPLGLLHGGAAVMMGCHAAEVAMPPGKGGARRRVNSIAANILSGIALGKGAKVAVELDDMTAVDGCPPGNAVVATLHRVSEDGSAGSRKPTAECVVGFA
mmetsp:Transcript_14904/g.50245  ORF Transcript_14904/g.50245 Transcript_14904/m.50245 type:complete len:320 (-) Transcript_14904:102-1061(-)